MNTNRLLVLACMCSGLSFSAWAQVGQNEGRPASDQASRDTRSDAMDKDRRGMKHDDIDRHPSMAVLRDSFGVSLRPLPRTQAASHQLKPGVGLVVEEVSANSMAANGKLQKGDIIFEVEDQWVINPEQFATLLSMQDVNDSFEVKVYRGTDRVDLDFKLDQAALDTMNRSLDPAMGGMDQRTDRTMDHNNTGLGSNPIIVPEKFDYKDDQHNISIRTEDGVKKLLVKDKDGNVLFDGPYNTAQDREAVPADVKMKVEQVLREKVK